MRAARRPARLAILAACGCITACAGQVRPTLPQSPRSEALLILPGFGYSLSGERALRALAGEAGREGIDLYVPTYISRDGLEASRSRLREYMREQRLDRYARVHVFAFLAGGWTLNPLIEAQALPNLATVVYDRSPLQERAARIATEQLHVLTWIRYGSPVFDFARTPYAPLTLPNVRVGLVVETRPTPFVIRHQAAARRGGPIDIDCDALKQRYDDCMYVAMNHSDLYARFAEVWPDVRAFVRTDRFTSSADRTRPSGYPFATTGTH